MAKQVTCIKKRGDHYDKHRRISSIGGIGFNNFRWAMNEEDAIRGIEEGRDTFHVSVNGRTVNVIVAIHEGRKYLKTTADGYSPDNLLSLPECS